MSEVPSGDAFAERLLQIIDEGRRTATYKLALLLALIDACAEQADEDGRPPEQLHTRVIAEHVVRLYFPQVRLYLAGDGRELELRQITNNRSTVLNAVLRLRMEADVGSLRTLTDVRRSATTPYEACIDRVEETFARYPLRLLQVLGSENRPFLYEIDWGQSVRLSQLHADGHGQVRFLPGTADHLLRLALCSDR